MFSVAINALFYQPLIWEYVWNPYLYILHDQNKLKQKGKQRNKTDSTSDISVLIDYDTVVLSSTTIDPLLYQSVVLKVCIVSVTTTRIVMLCLCLTSVIIST